MTTVSSTAPTGLVSSQQSPLSPSSGPILRPRHQRSSTNNTVVDFDDTGEDVLSNRDDGSYGAEDAEMLEVGEEEEESEDNDSDDDDYKPGADDTITVRKSNRAKVRLERSCTFQLYFSPRTDLRFDLVFGLP
jgi:hypothetical protein